MNHSLPRPFISDRDIMVTILEAVRELLHRVDDLAKRIPQTGETKGAVNSPHHDWMTIYHPTPFTSHSQMGDATPPVHNQANASLTPGIHVDGKPMICTPPVREDKQ